MNMKLLGAIGALAILAGGALAFQFADASTVTENVIAQHLAGRWIVNPEITARIDPIPSGLIPRAIEFTQDDQILAKLQEAYPRFRYAKIYMSGIATMNGEQHLFTVLSQAGNSYLVLFTPSRVSPVGEPHYMLIGMACSRDPSLDLLFLSGDPARQSAVAYDRATR